MMSSCIYARRVSARLSHSSSSTSSSSSSSSPSSLGLLHSDRQRLHSRYRYKNHRSCDKYGVQRQVTRQMSGSASLSGSANTGTVGAAVDGGSPPPITSMPLSWSSPSSSSSAMRLSPASSFDSSFSPSSTSRTETKGRATTPAPAIQTTGSLPGNSGGRGRGIGATEIPSPASGTQLPIKRYPSTQPPSHKRPEFRKTQLHRQYTALLRSSPLILLFQHSNLTAIEWMAVRRELAAALRAVEKAQADRNSGSGVSKEKKGAAEEKDEATAATYAAIAASGSVDPSIATKTRLQIVQTGILASALRIVEFYRPEEESRLQEAGESVIHPSDPLVESSTPISTASASPDDPSFTHALSRRAWKASKEALRKHKEQQRLQREQPQVQPQAQQQYLSLITPLLAGPVALLSFPTISPPHVAAALSILAPDKTRFPAPRRRVRPSYHDPAVQSGVQKLMLLGARADENLGLQKNVDAIGAAASSGVDSCLRIMDVNAVHDLAGIQGGIDELRVQLVNLLEGVGISLVSGALEGIGRSLWGVLEGRRMELEKVEKGEKMAESEKDGYEVGGA